MLEVHKPSDQRDGFFRLDEEEGSMPEFNTLSRNASSYSTPTKKKTRQKTICGKFLKYLEEGGRLPG